MTNENEFLWFVMRQYKEYSSTFRSFLGHLVAVETPYFHKINLKHIYLSLTLISLSISFLYLFISKNANINSTVSTTINHTQQNINRTKLNAFIISGDCNSLRYNTTKENIERVFPRFFAFICFLSIPLSDSRIHTSNSMLWRKLSSNLLAFVDLWTYEIPKYAQDNKYEWSFIFEDDVNFNDPLKVSLPNYIAPLQELMQNREVQQKDGFFYLGICGSKFINKTIYSILTKKNGSLYLYSEKGQGYCLHASAITAKRSRSFWGEIASYRPNSPDLSLDHQLREYTIRSKQYFYTFGSNFLYPPGTGHYGVAYQDRGRLPSTI